MGEWKQKVVWLKITFEALWATDANKSDKGTTEYSNILFDVLK